MAKKIKKGQLILPKSEQELDEFIAKIGDLLVKIQEKESAAQEEVDQVKAKCKKETEPLVGRAKELFEAVFVYAHRHQAELISADSKSVTLPHGMISWRTNPPKVEIDDEQELLNYLATYPSLYKIFVRIDPAINRQAILEKRDEAVVADLPGVEIVQDETFAVKPNQLIKEWERKIGKELKALLR